MQETAELIRRAKVARCEFNPRQLALVHHALTKPDAVYTFTSHQWSHAVSLETARTDLLDLAKRRLLQLSKRGRQFVFRPAPILRGRMEENLSRAT